MITTSLLVTYCVLLWHEWKRAGPLYGNLDHDAVLAVLIQIFLLVHQTKVRCLLLYKDIVACFK